jgi:signal transduction histidine kinase
VEERRRTLQGYVTGAFRIGDVIEATRQFSMLKGVELWLYDETAPPKERLLHTNQGPAQNRPGASIDEERRQNTAGLQWTNTFDVAGRRWTLRFYPTLEYLAAHRSWQAWTVLAASLLFTSLLGAFLLILTGRTAHIEQLVDERTAELSQANKELEQEVSERKHAQQAALDIVEDLDQSRKKAEQAEREIAAKNRDLQTLLHVISHDLREPLRAIENFSRMVHGRYVESLDEKGRDFLMRIVRGAQRMNALLVDILVLSHAQRLEPPTEEIDGKAIVEEAIKRLETGIKQLHAKIRIAKDLPGLYADKTWATQAVYNLIANALKFTRNGEPPKIEIAPYRSDGQVGIAVRDRGTGVASEHAERIFQLFQRAVGREIEGTGAGLAIVRQVAERHQGRAWVQPREGGGSEFIITFGGPAPGKGDENGCESGGNPPRGG